MREEGKGRKVWGGRAGGREGGWEGGREGGITEREGREGRDDCYTYSNIMPWHHSI